MSSETIKYCPDCLGNDLTSKDIEISQTDPEVELFGKNRLPMQYYTIFKGFATTYTKIGDNSLCPTCKKKMIEMNLTEDEWITLNKVSLEKDFIFAMDKLKQDDIIEFTTKMSQFKGINKQDYSSKIETNKEPENTPKCPTCGSSNIKNISGTKRWFGVGLFGLASSDIGKSMQCKNCGYKW